MRIKGKVNAITRDYSSGKWNITIEMDEGHINEIENYRDKDLSIDIKKYSDKRTNRANRYMWECINQLAAANDQAPEEPWDVYLRMLKKYGVKKYGIFKPEAVEAVKKQWRETIDLGEIDVNGQPARQLMLCFGSSTYTKEEFSRLIGGILNEMLAEGLDIPPTEETIRMLEEYGKET